MALSGLHVVCGVAGSPAELGGHAIDLPLMSYVLHWSETLATAGPTTKAVPVGASRSAFRVRCSVDAYVAVGKTPDAVNGPRFYVPANDDYDVMAPAEAKVAWVAA
ncbi:hypothetical protein ASG43_08870 [Aureimonas sp. Leaf454]|uniref:hypothetical protein n=1 Tax=Aureimonas sp. Leaf454 TaxID=1736381 RepID=UPI0006FA1D05|nr:hypothetical protein [Aureimonas sp. Leaf454]KQT48935.1 hypothetical protein ASG43_08870 [Aureimonas sp. Leaf454]